MKYILNGREVTQEEWDAVPSKLDELLGGECNVGGTPTTGWPMNCMSLSGTPKQAQQLRDRAKRHGLTGVEYKDNGDCVVHDKSNYAGLLKLEGLHNKAEGFHGA